jgi:hypothetical protein
MASMLYMGAGIGMVIIRFFRVSKTLKRKRILPKKSCLTP